MKVENETRVQITKPDAEAEGGVATSILPEKRVEKLIKENKTFTEVNRQEFAFVEVESVDEFLQLVPSTEVQLQIINVGYTLKQQKAANSVLQDSNFTPSATAYDLTELAAQPSTPGRTADPKTKAKNAFTKLAQEDPAAFAELLAQFNELATATK